MQRVPSHGDLAQSNYWKYTRYRKSYKERLWLVARMVCSNVLYITMYFIVSVFRWL